jgi:hypothetical protein
MPTKLPNPEDVNLIVFSIQRQNAIRSSEASNKTKQINTKISVLTVFLYPPPLMNFDSISRSNHRKGSLLLIDVKGKLQ